MIYGHFRATRAYEAVQGQSDLFKIRLQNDDVQNFDTRRDQAPLAASEIHSEMVLNCRILFSFRLYWLCMNKRIFETMDNQVLPD